MDKTSYIIYPLTLTMPEQAKLEFTAWSEKQEECRVDPYEVICNGKEDSVATSFTNKTGDYLKQVWPEVVEPLRQLAAKGNLIVTLQNLPLDRNLNNIPTPTDGRRVFEKGVVTELMSLAIASVMNTYIRVGVNEKEPFNSPFHQVVPQKGYENEVATNRGTAYFPLHNDRIFITDSIDFLILYGLRTEENSEVKTYFVPVSELIKDIPTNLFHALFEKEFKDPNSNVVISVLHGNPADYAQVTSTLDLADGWLDPTTDLAKEALLWLQNKERKLGDVKKYEVNIAPGVAVIADHRRILHGRRSFETSAGNFRRWLQRVHLCLR